MAELVTNVLERTNENLNDVRWTKAVIDTVPTTHLKTGQEINLLLKSTAGYENPVLTRQMRNVKSIIRSNEPPHVNEVSIANIALDDDPNPVFIWFEADGTGKIDGLQYGNIKWYSDAGELICNAKSDYMFYWAINCTEIDIIKDFNTTEVQDFNLMFYQCQQLLSLNIPNFKTSNATIISTMFGGCKSLKNINLSLFDTSRCNHIGGLITGCSSLTQISLTSFDTSNVTNYDNLFKDCSSLQLIDISSFDMSKVRIDRDMFTGLQECTIKCTQTTAEKILERVQDP